MAPPLYVWRIRKQRARRAGGGTAATVLSKYYDFRDTDPFVTDPTNGVGVTDSAGWTGSGAANIGKADRISSGAAQLAGCVYFHNSGSGTAERTFALPGAPGTYKIGVAVGDNFSQANPGVSFLDGSTTLFTVSGATNQDEFRDATNVARTRAAWLAGQAFQTVTIVGTSLTIRFLNDSSGGYTTLACVYIERIGP